jgi:hypothetical protein
LAPNGILALRPIASTAGKQAGTYRKLDALVNGVEPGGKTSGNDQSLDDSNDLVEQDVPVPSMIDRDRQPVETRAQARQPAQDRPSVADAGL